VDTAIPVNSTSTSASCPTLSQPGIPLGSEVQVEAMAPELSVAN